MQTRDQRYAMSAYDRVLAVQGKPGYERYGSLAHTLPVLIHRAGLAQALTFVDARIKEGDIARQILGDIAETIDLENARTLLERARRAHLSEYMLLTQQVLAALLWYKRFAQSLLQIEASDAKQEEQL